MDNLACLPDLFPAFTRTPLSLACACELREEGKIGHPHPFLGAYSSGAASRSLACSSRLASFSSCSSMTGMSSAVFLSALWR